jgi:hypothetical protein
MVCVLSQGALVAASDALPEYVVKAGYLYNFAMLTDWPQAAVRSTLDVCIMGNNEFGSAIEAIRGKTVSNRHIDVHVIETLREAKDCHILFASGMDRSSMRKLMTEIEALPILTVTDDESIARAGAMIFLRPENQHLVFEINSTAAHHANLQISSRLLRLARGTSGD